MQNIGQLETHGKAYAQQFTKFQFDNFHLDNGLTKARAQGGGRRGKNCQKVSQGRMEQRELTLIRCGEPCTGTHSADQFSDRKQDVNSIFFKPHCCRGVVNHSGESACHPIQFQSKLKENLTQYSRLQVALDHHTQCMLRISGLLPNSLCSLIVSQIEAPR